MIFDTMDPGRRGTPYARALDKQWLSWTDEIFFILRLPRLCSEAFRLP